MFKEYRRPFLSLLLLCSLLLSSGCGGGGGGGGVAPPQSHSTPPSPPNTAVSQKTTITCFPTSEGCISKTDYEKRRKKLQDAYRAQAAYSNQLELDTIRASKAYAQLELALGKGTRPGAGQTVGVIDTGIDERHPAFRNKRIHETFVNSASNEDGSRRSHGTAVSSVIVGDPDDTFVSQTAGTHGIAWGADITMFAVPTGSARRYYTPITPAGLSTADSIWTLLANTVKGWSSRGRQLDFINVSLGYNGIIDSYTSKVLRDRLKTFIPALIQSRSQRKRIFVFSAGNAHGKSCRPADFPGSTDLCIADPNDPTKFIVNAKSPEVLAGLAARIAELQGIVVAVAAVGSTGDIASFSNRCGLAANSCIAAPGVAIRTAYFGPNPMTNLPGARGSYHADGTSFAAPMVTGSLVVLKQFFRGQRSNTQLVKRLFDTANKKGKYSNKSIYGQGLLDLAAATAPQSETRIVVKGQASDAGNNIGQTWFNASNSLGDGLNRSIAGQEIVAFDNQGFPFWYSLDDFILPPVGYSSGARLQEFMAPVATESEAAVWSPSLGNFDIKPQAEADRRLSGLKFLHVPAQGTFGGHLSLVGQAFGLTEMIPNNWALTTFSNKGVDQRTPVTGAVMSWQHESMPFKVRFGFMNERKALLRSQSSGAFGGMSANSIFVGIDGAMQMGPWQLGAGAEIGSAAPSAAGGIISDISVLGTSTFAIKASRQINRRQSLSLHIAQPLRVESGHAQLTIPIGVNFDNTVTHKTLDVPLQPTGRQIELGAQWKHTFKNAGELRLGIVRIHDPNHSKIAKPNTLFMAGWRINF